MKTWNVIHTKPRQEKKVASLLSAKGYEVYLPLQLVMKQWSDRKKKVEEPLIKSYVFIQAKENNREQALFTPGVVKYLYWLGRPAEVPDEEIEILRQFLGEQKSTSSSGSSNINTEDEIEIQFGVLKSAKGKFISKHGNRLVINMELMNQTVKVEVPDRLAIQR